MSSRTLTITIIIILLLAVGVWGAVRILSSPKTETGTSTQSNETPTQTPQPQSEETPQTLNDCTRNFDRNKLQTAQVDTRNKFVTLSVKNFGDIKIQLFDQDAPKTVENFLRLANSGYYDCIIFHRVAKGFVIQAGDPTGTGRGGESAFGASFADELNPQTPSYKTGYVKGVVAMANAGPNTNTSQFFIIIGDASFLPHSYTIFGKVVAGQPVADKIGQVEIEPVLGPTDGSPKTAVVIQKATISNR